MNYEEIILDYYKDLILNKNAKEEVKKNKFQDLLSRLFPSAVKERQEYTSNLEKSVKVTSSGLVTTGQIDAYFGDLVIEFERNVPQKLDEGCRQIKQYCSALWNEKADKKPYIGIVTDGLNWYVYYPTADFERNVLEPEDVTLQKKEAFYLNGDQKSVSYFFAFINRLFFREQIITPSIENFKKDFGVNSILYENVFKNLSETFSTIRNNKEVILSFKQWEKYLTYTYGTVAVSEDLYLKHSYLCVLARFIIWAALAKHTKKTVESGSLNLIHELISGAWFKNYGIINLVEADFFHWVTHKSVREKLSFSWLLVLNQLHTYNFDQIKEDLLKGLYQELIDPENRHDLGEYYTPDWLCETISKYLFDKAIRRTKNEMPKTLDPACGSGSFLRALIHRAIQFYSEKYATQVDWSVVLSDIFNKVVGLDIHPLAVIIAKANYILTIKDIFKYRRTAQITIPVYLADSLFMPEGEADNVLFGKNDITIKFSGKDYKFPQEAMSSTTSFDTMILFSTSIAYDIAEGNQYTKASFMNTLQRQYQNNLDKEIIESITETLYQLTKELADKIKNKENTIWSFILRNNFRPLFFKNQFDIIIGNPPWLTYNNISDVEYQKEIKKLAVDEYKIAPKQAKLMTQLELASLFFVHVCDKFLKNRYFLGFVMPRSILNADQHKIFRAETWDALCDVTEYWDLEGVSPIFNVPTCVIFATKKTPVPNKEYKTRFYSTEKKLPEKDIPLEAAEKLISYKTGKLYQCKLGNRSALHSKKIVLDNSLSSYYKGKFFQGATIVPRSFYFIESPKPNELSFSEFSTRTDLEQAKEAKNSWKGVTLSGNIEVDFLFHTALSKNILPFFLTELPYVVLPMIHNKNQFLLKTAKELRHEGFIHFPRWLEKAEKEWALKTADKLFRMNLYQRLDYQKTLTNQKPDHQWKVLYNTSGTNISACILNTRKLDKPFYADAKTYWYDAANEIEAYYLLGILNSKIANELIKPFQSKGLLGPRDIHTKALEIPFPQFDKGNSDHVEVSKLSKKASLKIKSLYEKNRVNGSLASQRKQCREAVNKEIKQITEQVKRILSF